MLNNYICALDIGSSKIAAVVAQLKRKHITNLFFDSLAVKGIKRGVIIDSIDLTGSITRLLKSLKIKSGINIKSVYTNISGQNIVTKHSHAVIPLAERGNKVITALDINKVNEQARILGSGLEEEIIHQIPLSYTIDSMTNIVNPIGLYSHRLEVDLYLISSNVSSLQSLARVINQAGYEIKDIFFSGIATSKIAFDTGLQEGINVLCDIGLDVTELLIFKDGLLNHIDILSLGGNDFTEGLSDTLKIPLDLAEDVKRSHGMVGDYNQIRPEKEILIKKDNIYKSIKQKLVSQVLSSKTNSMCSSLKDTIRKTIPTEDIHNFVTVGRAILLEGFLENMEEVLGIPLSIGRLIQPDAKVSIPLRNTPKMQYTKDIISLVNRNPSLCGQNCIGYITALGIICQALEHPEPQFSYTKKLTPQPVFKIINKVREIYQEYF
jgi:cell division protein FtsA